MVYTQREGSAALPATVDSVNYPGRDEGPAAQVIISTVVLSVPVAPDTEPET